MFALYVYKSEIFEEDGDEVILDQKTFFWAPGRLEERPSPKSDNEG